MHQPQRFANDRNIVPHKCKRTTKVLGSHNRLNFDKSTYTSRNGTN